MGASAVPDSPKHGYHFDGHEHDVRRSRKRRPCEGGRFTRGSHFPGKVDPECTGTIEAGTVYVATILDLFTSESHACITCALAVGAVTPDNSEPKELTT